MKLEHQVANLELSKRLKELGVVQESAFYWFSMNHEKFNVVGKNFTKITDWSHNQILNVTFPDALPIIYSAFTVAELGVMLPLDVYSSKTNHTPPWRCETTSLRNMGKNQMCLWFAMETEADARAKMLIYLIENKLVTVVEGNL